jgi:hypothetical protein
MRRHLLGETRRAVQRVVQLLTMIRGIHYAQRCTRFARGSPNFSSAYVSKPVVV